MESQSLRARLIELAIYIRKLRHTSRPPIGPARARATDPPKEQVSRPGVEIATRARQQIRRPYGKPRIGEASNLQKIVLTVTQISERKSKLLKYKV